MKFSPSGKYILSSDTLPYSALGWDWLLDGVAIGYGGFDTPQVGLYTYDFASKALTRLGDFDVALQRRIFADGHGRWLADLTTGPLDSAGRRWPDDRNAVGLSPEGDQIFVSKPGFDALIIRAADGAERAVPVPATNGSTVTMSGGVLLYGYGAGVLGAIGAPAPICPPGAMQTFRTGPDGQRFIVGYVAGWGLCLYPWVANGPCRGYCLSTDGKDFYPDLYIDSASEIRVGSSETQADSIGRLYDVDLGAKLYRVNAGLWQPLISVDLFQPPVVALPTIGQFTHPVSIAPFKDPAGESGADAEIVVNHARQTAERPCWVSADCLGDYIGPLLGIYSEKSDPSGDLDLAARLRTRLAWCHDATSLPTIPPGLRPWDQAWLELYRSKGETLAQSIDRWRWNVIGVLNQWSGDCGLVPQCYCQGGAPPDELWTVQEVLDGLSALSTLVNLSPRIKVVAPFSWQRANGIVAHPELRAAFDRVLAATPGIPTFHQIGQAPAPSPSPSPAPGPSPSPIPPVSYWPRFVMPFNSDPTKFYRILIGKFQIGVSPTPVSGKSGDDAFPTLANPTGTNGRAQVTEREPGRFDVLFVDAQRQWSLPPTQDLTTPSLGQTRVKGTLGGWETPYIKAHPTKPESEIGIGFRCEGDDQTSGVIFTVIPE